MIKFSVLKYSIIYSLMAQTTLAVQINSRDEWRGQVGSPVCGLHVHSACIEFSSQGALVVYSPGNFWKMVITRLNLEAIFNQLWVQDE